MKKLSIFLLVPVFLMFCGFIMFGRKSENKRKAIEEFNFVIGTQTVGSKYQFTEKTMLVETAEAIRDMGSNVLKFSMHPRYCTENYGLPKNDNIKSLTDLATLEPSMKRVLNMDFKYYHIWTYGFSQYTQEPEGTKIDTMQIKFINGYPDRYEKALFNELYDFTKHLLTSYNGSGKIFYLGHWEGDWHLRWHYDRTKPVDSATLNGMIKWAKVRQRAIDQAKADFPSDVEVYNYMEVNLVMKGMKEPQTVTVTNSILNEVNPDYVSYSSYDATNPFKTEGELRANLTAALNYIEQQLKPKNNLPPGKRVWIGEYGSPISAYDQQQQDERSKWVIKTGLAWGTPFILYWELYNNEINSETLEHVGYWMIDDQGEKQLVWHTHHNFYKEARAYIKNYLDKNGKLPTCQQFQKDALLFKSLN
jgi:hypothetical protein